VLKLGRFTQHVDEWLAMLNDQHTVTDGSVTAELYETGEPPTELLAVRRLNKPLSRIGLPPAPDGPYRPRERLAGPESGHGTALIRPPRAS